jgi:metal-responsive CopG/Arc/MetJ family transcriptional regulator
MQSDLGKQQVVVSLDAVLLERLDRLTGDRNQAIESAIRLWCDQQSDNVGKMLQRSAQVHQQRHDNDETGWLV